MFVITKAEVAAVVEAYRTSGSLEAAAAVLRATFRALTESQARRLAAHLLGVPPDRKEPPPTA